MRLRGPSTGQIALGTGRYGHPVVADFDQFKLPTLVLGAPRSGKTREGNNIDAQQVRCLGGGACIIDFKAGDDVVAYWAEVAKQEGRAFHHFTLDEKAGGAYQRPHPYAPDSPSFYDPLVRGNGESKTSMLLNSVDRDGDAAAYLRTAEDVVMLAFDIADLSGESVDKGGLETLGHMLDLAALEKASNSLTVDAVVRAHPTMSTANARRRVSELQTRVSEMRQKSKPSSVLTGAITDSQTLVSKFANSSALGGRLRPGAGPADTIDLVRAVLQGEIVVFSLPSNDYRMLSVLVATMVLLDLQNTTSTLRKNINAVRSLTGDTSTKADKTPWPPFIVQVEELGTARSSAAAAALLGLVNKSSNEGMRLVLSSQGWGDFVAVDGTGVWARQILASVQNVIAFQLNASEDDAVVCDYSGTVEKKRPRVSHELNLGGRWRLRSGAQPRQSGMTETVHETAIPYGTLQALRVDPDQDIREFVWIAKAGSPRCTHTVPQGPNSWFETLRLACVHEPPYPFDPWADPDAVAQSEVARDEILESIAGRIRSDKVLSYVLSTAAAATGLAHVPESGQDSTPGQDHPATDITVPQVSDGDDETVDPILTPSDPWAHASSAAPTVTAHTSGTPSDDWLDTW